MSVKILEGLSYQTNKKAKCMNMMICYRHKELFYVILLLLQFQIFQAVFHPRHDFAAAALLAAIYNIIRYRIRFYPNSLGANSKVDGILD